ncbi:unnamed protein product [Cyprideis torosa]|uniref:Uncharacterized protein n=1 Tax=Cyprideis torosa TaxID=163714 RepID=A0A7R8W8Q1_9CRUS|nr:unnamed protein product [Cyprideis torosa]CAG0883698.1 unnamed protein product [Cyprideis torosa]
MNLHSFFRGFNPSKFIVYLCLLLFTICFALRLDGVITWSWWAVFIPIWVWKFFVIFGALVGSYVWWRYPLSRFEGEAYIQYKAMLIALALHLLLLMFELLVCDKLESGRHLWTLVFVPLVFISILCVAVCIWAVKHDRSFEMELFCAVNVLQFIFLALKLDGFITWSWEVVFTPLWIIMCISLVGVLYSLIFASILWRSSEVDSEQRRASIHSAIGYTFLVRLRFPFCDMPTWRQCPMRSIHELSQFSQVLLANKLDAFTDMSYLVTISPLFVSFATLVCMSFGSRVGNYWWFGIRKDFCHFLLIMFPCLQEYGNISYSLHSDDASSHEQEREASPRSERRPVTPMSSASLTLSSSSLKVSSSSSPFTLKGLESKAPIIPVSLIDMPD